MTTGQVFERIRTLSSELGFKDTPHLEMDDLVSDVAGQEHGNIRIREREYGKLSDAEKCVIMAHEWGHYAEKQIRERFFDGVEISDEMISDWYVAYLGFCSELKAARGYGAEYNKIVDLFEDPRAFGKRISTWELRKLAGLTET